MINDNNNKKNINNLFKIVILFTFVLFSNPTLGQNRFIVWLTYGIIIACVFWSILTTKIKINLYHIWLLFLIGIVLASIMWSKNANYSLDILKSLLPIYLIFIFISILVNERKQLYQILKLFFLSQIITAFYILIHTDWSYFGLVRIGIDTLGEGWNSNAIGMNMALATFIGMVLIYTDKKVKLTIYYLLGMILLSYITLMTGSRKSFFILIFSIGFYYIFMSRSKFTKLYKILFSLFFTGLLIYMVLNIPVLYGVLGSRIESFFARFTGQGIVDASVIERNLMIEYGLNLWKEKPILGYGVNSFRDFFGSYVGGRETYSHNNYVELLVSVGLVGSVIYYSIFLYVIILTRKRNHELLIFAFISMITILFIDIGLVSYYNFNIQLLICLSFISIEIYKSESNKILFNNKTLRE